MTDAASRRLAPSWPAWCLMLPYFPCCLPLLLSRLSPRASQLFLAAGLWLLGPFLAGALLMRFYSHPGAAWAVFPREARALTSHRFADGLWCAGVRLSALRATPLTAYLLPRAPAVDAGQRVVSSVAGRRRVAAGRWFRVSVFLPPSSGLAAAVCSERGAQMAVVRGDGNLSCVAESLARTGHWNDDCVLDAVFSRRHVGCDASDLFPEDTLEFETGNASVQFHVVYIGRGWPSANVTTLVTVNRSSLVPPRYIHGVRSCSTTTRCDLRYRSDRWRGQRTVAVLEVGAANRTDLAVSAECIPDPVAYLLVFAQTPMILFFLAGVGIVAYRRRRTAAEEEEALLGAEEEDESGAGQFGPFRRRELLPIAEGERSQQDDFP